MNEQHRHRLAFLSAGACTPLDYIDEYYGLPWPPSGDDDDLRRDFEAWRARLRRRARCQDGEVSRYELESFMLQKEVIPNKWMAARLGMTLDSLELLMTRLPDLQMRPQRYRVYRDLIAKSLYDHLAPNLPGLKFVVFSDEEAFCRRLHVELKKELGIDVQPLFCATSDRLGEEPRQFARDFDCITLEPLSARHQVWLEFPKPINLSPDRCSNLFYAENRDDLRPYCFGKRDPEDLVDLLRSPARNSRGGYHGESSPAVAGESLMRGRKPLPLSLAPGDRPILEEVARSRSLPFYQVQHARRPRDRTRPTGPGRRRVDAVRPIHGLAPLSPL